MDRNIKKSNPWGCFKIIILILFWPITLCWLIWKKTNFSKKVKVSLTIAVVFTFFIGLAMTSSPKRESPVVSTVDQTINSSTSQEELKSEFDYKIIKSFDNSTIQNLYYIINERDKSEQRIQKLATEIKSKDCKTKCNIYIFDDLDALNKDYEYSINSTKTSEDMTLWKKQNYVFVANHHVAMLTFETDKISYYPYKDWHYNELNQGGKVEGVNTNNRQKAKVIRVIDGDTIEIENGLKVRYIGIDTPESVDPRTTVQCFGKEASLANKELVEGKDIELEKDVSEKDKYGRLLRYVYLDDVLLNELLVAEGYAKASSYPPDIKYQEIFKNAEAKARDNSKGLWKACTFVASNTTTPVPIKQTDESTSGESCNIKGNINSEDEKIYHIPGCQSYNATKIDSSRGERWFCSESEAVKAGWRKAQNCN